VADPDLGLGSRKEVPLRLGARPTGARRCWSTWGAIGRRLRLLWQGEWGGPGWSWQERGEGAWVMNFPPEELVWVYEERMKLEKGLKGDLGFIQEAGGGGAGGGSGSGVLTRGSLS
jgi:hypothetical protein